LSYALQTVSEVEGRLREGVGLTQMLEALHPGGSVTGAPKNAALERIAALESSPRQAYCASLGLAEQERGVFAMLIRTAWRAGGDWVYGVGGGIVYDSSAESEYDELLLKLGALGGEA
ncbi:MAG: chorismate-binding protein, partial [Myxococcota bacterium]|nr:chorismate-binding protein [Myxococcota bacterium]